MPLLRMRVHCPRASNGLLPRRSNLVGYVRRDARSDRFPPCQTIIPTAFRSQSGLPTTRSQISASHTDRARSESAYGIGCPGLQDRGGASFLVSEQGLWMKLSKL